MKKRLMLSLMTVALVALLASGATFALFTAQTESNTSTLTAGTVTFGKPCSFLANVGPLAPGDEGNIGTFSVKYTGNLKAWIGVKGIVTGDLKDVLDVTIKHGNNEYDADGNIYAIGTYPAFYNRDIELTAKYDFDINSGNTYQGKTATFKLQVFAVQYKNNDNPFNP